MARTVPQQVGTATLARILGLLGSWQLSVVLTVAGAVYAVFLAIWGGRAPAHVVRTIAGMLPFQVLWTLLLVNTGLCLVERWRPLVARCRRAPVFVPERYSWRRAADEPPEAAGAPIQADGGWAWVRHRWAALGTLLLHLALFLLAAGFALSAATRTQGRIVAGLGQRLQASAGTYRPVGNPSRPTAALPDLDLAVEDIDASFWRDELLFTDLRTRVLVNGHSHTVAINDPAFLSPFTQLRLTSFGYAPVYLLMMDGVARPLEEGAVVLDVFPPGTRDSFSPQHFPHDIYLRFYPDYEAGPDGPRSRSMNLVNPRVAVEVYRGKVFVAAATLHFGEPLAVEEFSFAILDALPTAELTVVRDAGLPLVVLGLITALVGLVLRLPGQRSELWITELDGGRWEVRGWNLPEMER